MPSRTNIADGLFGKNGIVYRNATIKPAFADSIVGILSRCSLKKMVRSNATPNVATVADIQVFGYESVGKYKRNSMSGVVSMIFPLADMELTISLFINRIGPNPTRLFGRVVRRYSNLRPKAGDVLRGKLGNVHCKESNSFRWIVSGWGVSSTLSTILPFLNTIVRQARAKASTLKTGGLCFVQ